MLNRHFTGQFEYWVEEYLGKGQYESSMCNSCRVAATYVKIDGNLSHQVFFAPANKSIIRTQ